MKERKKIKLITIILLIVLMLQHLSIIMQTVVAYNGQDYGEVSETIDGITWYGRVKELYGGNIRAVDISPRNISEISGKITIPSKLRRL